MRRRGAYISLARRAREKHMFIDELSQIAERKREREREKRAFNDKQSEIAERKTVDQQGPGDRGKEDT